jgi:hypothetical protein
VRIGSEPGVIGEIPTWVIGIVVYHDIVAVPQPIAGVAIVVRGHVPEEATEPEMVPVSAFEAINVVATNFSAEVPVFPYVILMITSVVAAPVMTDPLIAVSMNVRGFGMALLVAIGWTSLLATGMRLVAARAAATCSASLLRLC